MIKDELTEKIICFVRPIVEAKGLDLIEIIVRRHSGICAIEVIADRPKGGIVVDECAYVNSELVKKIEEDGFLGDNFMIEVSSPGLDRPLVTQKDFDRNVGKSIRVHLKEKLEEKLEHSGRILEVINGNISIVTKDKTFVLPIDKIQKAVQII